MVLKLNRTDVIYYLLMLMAFFPLMPFGVLSICTIVLSIVSVVLFYKNILSNFKQRKIPFLINIVFFIILILSSLYSNNVLVALKEIQRDLNILIFPITMLLLFPSISKKQFEGVVNAYLISTTVLLMILIVIITHYGVENQHLRSFLDYPYRSIIEGKLHIHVTPTYLSMWFSLSIIFLLENLKKTINKGVKVSLMLLAIIFYLFIFISAARMVFLSLNAVLFILFLFRYKVTIKKKLIALGALLILIFSIGLIFSKTSFFKERYYNEIFERKIKDPRGRTPSSLSIRYGIYKCTKKLILEAPLFGYGIGDIQQKLNECYKSSYRSSFYKKKKFDSHNYYFSVMLSGGIFALVAFVCMFGYNLKLALSQDNVIYVCFLLLVMGCCLTENILNRVYGTIFFAFFNALFLLKIINTKKEC